jgi:hypothetical protein
LGLAGLLPQACNNAHGDAANENGGYRQPRSRDGEFPKFTARPGSLRGCILQWPDAQRSPIIPFPDTYHNRGLRVTHIAPFAPPLKREVRTFAEAIEPLDLADAEVAGVLQSVW